MTTKWLRLSLIILFVFVVGLAFYGLVAVDMLVNDRAAQEEARLIERQIRERQMVRFRETVIAVNTAVTNSREELVAAKKKIATLESKIEKGTENVAASKKMLARGIDEKFSSLSSEVNDVRRTLQKRSEAIVGVMETVRQRHEASCGRRIAELQREVAEQKELVQQAKAQTKTHRPTQTMLEQELLHPTVQVLCGKEVGSGTVIYSNDGETFVLTALHVVVEDGQDDAKISVKFFGMKELISIPATIFASEKKIDVAILRLATPRKMPHVARFVSKKHLAKVSVFSPVYAMGCPLGYGPMQTRGEISSKTKILKGQNYWMMNAPTIFGNSGGGIFTEETCELIGFLSRVSAYNNFVNIAVPHMGIFVSMEDIYDWMDREGLMFLYDPKCPRELFEPRGAAKEEEK